MDRRQFLFGIGALAAVTTLRAADAPARFRIEDVPLTPADEIQRRVRAARPKLGGAIPRDLSRRLGATHYAGKYHLTDEPFLIEGCRQLQKLGMNIAKLWFGRQLDGYGYNSKWDIARNATLADIARHEYFRQAFAMPFATFALEIQPVGNYGGAWHKPGASYAEDEQQFYDLTKHLLQSYKDRDVLFILQHWEGDWMVRDKPGDDWQKNRPAYAEQRCDAMARWLEARQRGVTRARKDFGPARCRVDHAAEVNRVFDGLQGVPTLLTHVLPRVGLDRVSWSCYDGVGDAVKFWHGVELIRAAAKPPEDRTRTEVFIGEIGIPERQRTPAEVEEFWDRSLAVCFALDIPHIFAWELYCNEIENKSARGPVYREEDLRGFWLIKPDGTLGVGGRQLTELLTRSADR